MVKILITGGTGTLGKALISKLYNDDVEIHIFSRDENKQKALKAEYPKLVCHIGDVCDRDDLNRINYNKFSYVYHCAAMKHVEICEANVAKCVKTNYAGTRNVYWALGKSIGVKFCFFTTDKAVAPVNAYGHSKALAEKFLEEMNVIYNNAYIFRWGNILGSTGSVLPIFVKQLLSGKPITVTHTKMTRFWLPIDYASDFVLATVSGYKPGIHWPSSIRSSSLVLLIQEMASILEIKNYEIKEIGLRPGEKIHEAMLDGPEGPIITSDDYSVYNAYDLNRLIRPIVLNIADEVNRGT